MKFLKKVFCFFCKIFTKCKCYPSQLKYEDVFDFGMYCRNSYGSVFYETGFPFKELNEAGFSFAYVYDINYDDMVKTLESAKENNMKILWDGYYQFYPYTKKENVKRLTLSMNYPDNFMGFISYDEPHLERKDGESMGYLDLANGVSEKIMLCEEESGLDFTGKIHIINCLPNYALEKQVINGEYDSKNDKYVCDETYEKYVNAVAEKKTDIVIGDFYGPSSNDELNKKWPSYIKIMRNASLKYNKPMWQYICGTQHNGFLVNDEATLKFRVYFNMIWGAQALIYFKLANANSKNWINSIFNEDGTIGTTYELVKNMQTGEFKTMGSFFKNSVINNVDFYDKESKELPVYIDSITEGTLCIASITKNEHNFLAVFGYTNGKYVLNSKIKKLIDKELKLNSIKEFNIVINYGDIALYYID